MTIINEKDAIKKLLKVFYKICDYVEEYPECGVCPNFKECYYDDMLEYIHYLEDKYCEDIDKKN